MRSRQTLESSRHAAPSRLRHEPDSRLVEMVRAGNERAFEAIVSRYRAPLLRQSARILQPERAEEAVQETFVKAHRAMHNGDAELELRPWLYRIAHNTSLNLLRQVRFGDQELDETIDGVERPDEAFERRDRIRRLIVSIQRLPARQRDAVVLHELEGRSYREIAGRLEVSDGAVRQLLARGRDRLRSAVAAVTPAGLLGRLGSGPETAGTIPDSVGFAGAGGLSVGVKVAVAVLASGAVIAGGASLPTLHHSSRAAGPNGSARPLNGALVEAAPRLARAPSRAYSLPRGRSASPSLNGTASTVRRAEPATGGDRSVSGRDQSGDGGRGSASDVEDAPGLGAREGRGQGNGSNEPATDEHAGGSSQGADSSGGGSRSAPGQEGSSAGGGPGPSAPTALDGGGDTSSGMSGSDGGLATSRQGQSESTPSTDGH